MGSFSLVHWLVVILIAMLFFGRGKISELMGDMAKGITSFKKGLADGDAPHPPAGYVPPPGYGQPQGYAPPPPGYAPQPTYAPPHLAPPAQPMAPVPTRDDVPRS